MSNPAMPSGGSEHAPPRSRVLGPAAGIIAGCPTCAAFHRLVRWRNTLSPGVEDGLPVALATEIARRGIEEARAGALEGHPVDPEATALREAERLSNTRLRRVINATGVILHTNLGRAPLHPSAAVEAGRAATGYGNLEFDLAEGRRGSRGAYLSRLMAHLTGAEAALVVNNNAAALFLVLHTLAAGRPVPVSRGELIEIGGSYRPASADGGFGSPPGGGRHHQPDPYLRLRGGCR